MTSGWTMPKNSKVTRAGKVTVSAPVPGLANFKWTTDVNEEFHKAMKRVHGLER